jgi:hypothetical protein
VLRGSAVEEAVRGLRGRVKAAELLCAEGREREREKERERERERGAGKGGESDGTITHSTGVGTSAGVEAEPVHILSGDSSNSSSNSGPKPSSVLKKKRGNKSASASENMGTSEIAACCVESVTQEAYLLKQCAELYLQLRIIKVHGAAECAVLRRLLWLISAGTLLRGAGTLGSEQHPSLYVAACCSNMQELSEIVKGGESLFYSAGPPPLTDLSAEKRSSAVVLFVHHCRRLLRFKWKREQ